MKRDTKKRLSDAGWRIGSASDFLGFSAEEAAYIELRISLCRHLKEKRKERGWTQTRLAKEIGSSLNEISVALMQMSSTS